MHEGWFNDDYWPLCEDQREAEHLPGYSIVGLKGWDFILAAANGAGQTSRLTTRH